MATQSKLIRNNFFTFNYDYRQTQRSYLWLKFLKQNKAALDAIADIVVLDTLYATGDRAWNTYDKKRRRWLRLRYIGTAKSPAESRADRARINAALGCVLRTHTISGYSGGDSPPVGVYRSGGVLGGRPIFVSLETTFLPKGCTVRAERREGYERRSLPPRYTVVCPMPAGRRR